MLYSMHIDLQHLAYAIRERGLQERKIKAYRLSFGTVSPWDARCAEGALE